MRPSWVLLLLVITLQSCNYFETQKVDAQTLFEQEMATINWDEVDQYPLFANCDETQTKAQQLQCFHGQLSASLHTVLKDSIQGVLTALNDTIHLELQIDTLGVFSLKKIQMDSLTRSQLPNLDKWFAAAVSGITPIAPATKRGVPVSTLYTLPVAFVTD